jgi:hypothetical protein
MVTALSGNVCQWKPDSADAAADLLSKAITAHFNDQRSIAHYSVSKQVPDVIAFEVVVAQEAPK